MALTLDATNKIIDVTTTTTAPIDWTVSWVDMTTTGYTPGDSQGTINTATTTLIVAAPAASTQRGIKAINLCNTSTSATQTLTIKKDVGGTEYGMFKATLQPGETLSWNDGGEWRVFDSVGRQKVTPTDTVGIEGRTSFYYKTGTGSDTVAYWYGHWKDTGFPGAWSPGTPGVNGRITLGTSSSDVGCLPIWTPSANLYLSQVDLTTTLIHSYLLADVLWVNTGLVVTTTTAQAIVTPALPARDMNGTSNGKGCIIGLIFTAAATNAAVINNATVTYTNSNNVPSKTATLINIAGDQIPTSPAIGTIVWFQLAAGCEGVKSIESITLGTSLVTGSISLIIARPIAFSNPVVANLVATTKYSDPGIRLYNDSCLHWFYKSTSTTATTMNSTAIIVDR